MTDEEKQSLIDQFKAGLAPDSAAAMADRLASAETRLAALDGGDTGTLVKERDDATARAQAAEGKLAEAEKARDDALAAAASSKKAASAAKAALPPAPRKLGPLDEKKSIAGDDLRKAIEDAEEIEIAFSNGRMEVDGLAPVALTGFPFAQKPNGLMLTEPVDLYGPGRGEGAYSVAGYVLILDGKPVSYTARDPFTIAPGQHVKIEDDIIFA